jgi:hypothetical protein
MEASVRTRPVIFSGPMVKAILEGRKTQTRRIVKVDRVSPNGCPIREVVPSLFVNTGDLWDVRYEIDNPKAVRCPYGQPGDCLWVRETWAANAFLNRTKPRDLRGETIYYRATYDNLSHFVWRPSIHMPRWASRITLEIEEVRVERLQSISEEDKLAEGATAEVPFGTVWRKLYTEPGIRFEDDPWVWCLTFRRLEATP